MLTDDLRHLVRATIEHAGRWHDDEEHTVAAGLLTASGRIVLGLNTYHFLGGPCGEIAALSNHAATAPEDPITAVAAAYGRTGEVIAPCGKCRQVLFDVSPAIRFVVRDANGLTTRTAEQLLPLAYDWRHAERPQQIHLWEGYETAVRAGRKRQTIRVDDPFRPGPAELVIEKGNGPTERIPVTVTAVRTVDRQALTAQDARRDGFASLEALHAALDAHYPGLASADEVDVVTFAPAAADPEAPPPSAPER